MARAKLAMSRSKKKLKLFSVLGWPRRNSWKTRIQKKLRLFGVLRWLWRVPRKSRNEEKLRWFSALRWLCTSRTKKKQFTEDSYVAPVRTSQKSLPHSTISYISGNEGKIKESSCIFKRQRYCYSSMYTTKYLKKWSVLNTTPNFDSSWGSTLGDFRSVEYNLIAITC